MAKKVYNSAVRRLSKSNDRVTQNRAYPMDTKDQGTDDSGAKMSPFLGEGRDSGEYYWDGVGHHRGRA